ncbi:MAG: S1/P1 nuclease [Alistipes sp.]
MKKTIILLVIALCCGLNNVLGWGKLGHDAVAYIAECNLTPKAKKTVEQYLGHSIVYFATWMDEYRSTPAYRHTSGWHAAAVDADSHYVPNKTGDAVSTLESAISILKDYKNQDDSTVVVNLKLVVHLVGDIHCPVHVKYPDINSYNITINGKEYRYHNVWDERLLEMSHTWYYTEYQHQLDRCTKREQQQIVKGSPREWFQENAIFSRQIYDLATKDCTLDKEVAKDFLNAAHPIAEHQILYAGYRLAAVLNELFG